MSLAEPLDTPPWKSPEWQEAVSQNPGLKPFLDNLESFVELPGGVVKLRGLFIGLGVSGKLVAQIADDQPASAVVLECERLRTSLAADGKLSNRKRLSEVELSEQEFTAPLGWEWVRINHICDHRLGKMLDKAKNQGKPYPYLRNTNVQWHEFDLTDVKEMRFEEDELDEYEVRSGDLMVCEGGYPGRCAIWSGETPKMMFQKAIHRVRPLGGIKSKFILLRLWCDSQRGHLNQHFTGATIKHFTGKELARYAICLPPLAEQRRIVSKVEGLMSLCDTLENYRRERESVRERASRSVLASLTSAPRVAEQVSGQESLASAWQRLSDHFEVLLDQPESIPHLRQSILQLAVQGKLVSQDPSDEPAASLVERIRKGRNEIINRYRLGGTNEFNLITADERPFTLPDGWCWCRFGEFGAFMGGGTPYKGNAAYWTGDIPWVTPKDMKRPYMEDAIDHVSLEGIDNSSAKIVPPESLLMVVRGMILIHSFPVAIAKRELAINQDMKALVLGEKRISRYLLLTGQASRNRMLERVERSTHGTCRLATEDVAAFVVGLPPLAEQKRIVSKADSLLTQCDELSARLRSRQSTTDALLTALIHRILNGAGTE